MNTYIDASLHDIICASNPHHVGVFEANDHILEQVQPLWIQWNKDSNDVSVQLAFKSYPKLEMIFNLLTRPGSRAFVLSTRSGKTLALVRVPLLHGEGVYFRWIEDDMSDMVAKQCLARNIYGHAVTVWAYGGH